MAHALEEIRHVTDAELVSRVEHLVKVDRALGVKLLVHLGEIDERKLHLERGYSSMYDYCRNALRMSEGESSLRVKAARVGRRYPLVLERLGSGAVHLSGIKLLGRFFTAENHEQLLDRMRGMTKRQIERLVAELDPKPDAPARLRKLPTKRAPLQSPLLSPPEAAVPVILSSPGTSAAPISLSQPQSPMLGQQDAAPAAFALQSPQACASTKPLSPGRFKLEVTLGQEAHDKLEQLQELLGHQNPNGDLARIVERAVSELLEHELKRRFAQTKPRKQSVSHEPTGSGTNASAPGELGGETAAAVKPSSSRYIPRGVVREVYARDGGQCTFVSPEGRRCTTRRFLEVHHHGIPFAHGGAATADNLRLACRAHNFLFAERDYGRSFMQQKLRAAQEARSANKVSRNASNRTHTAPS